MAVALTQEQYQEIITTMQTGGQGFRPNHRIAAALMMETNLGLRIGDILQLKLSDIVRDGGRYRLNIVEEKTGKKRTFTVPPAVYAWIRDYADQNGIEKSERLFPVTVRAVQKHLKLVCDYLEIEEDISTHSFRKLFATTLYNENNHDLVLVQNLLQHSSPAITRRYIGISEERMEQALSRNVNLI